MLLVSTLFGLTVILSAKSALFGYQTMPYLVLLIFSTVLTSYFLILAKKYRKDSPLNRVIFLLGFLFVGWVLFLGLFIFVNWWNHRNYDRALVQAEVLQWSERLNLFKSTCGRFPLTEEGLKALITLSDKSICPNYPSKGFTEGGIVWGHDISYESDGKTYILKSHVGGETFRKTENSEVVQEN